MEVKVTLRNPLNKDELLEYYIIPDTHQLAQDWIVALKEILSTNLKLQKEFCFLGFPNTPRTLEYLCKKLNKSVEIINNYDYTKHDLPQYVIEEWFHPDVVRFSDKYTISDWGPSSSDSPRSFIKQDLGLTLKHSVMNQLHNHFEKLEGTIERPSPYGQVSPPEVRQAIGNLNHLCHEIESLVLSQRKQRANPDWIRPSQITTFDKRKRYELTDEHRQGFLSNRYDRQFGHVYTNWTQIGKTLVEVFRDEDAPDLNATTCEAITHLKYYSGEFDVEWAQDVTRKNKWHAEELIRFDNWLLKHGYDPKDPKLSSGYLHIGQVDLQRSFNTTNIYEVWKQLETHLDIYSIEVDGVKQVFDYCWSDDNEVD